MHLTLYIWTICIAALSITGLNIWVFQPEASLTQMILWGLLNPWAIIACDAILATIIHNLPRKWMNPYRKCFTVPRRELSIYRKTKIIIWKEYVPETGKLLTGLSKSKIEGTKSDYLYRFLEETCYAEWVHYGMALSGFLTLIFTPVCLWKTMIIPQIIVNLILNLPPSFIQRNNRPKLLTMYEHSKKGEQR